MLVHRGHTFTNCLTHRGSLFF